MRACRRRDFGHFSQQLYIGGTMIKVIVSYQTAEWFAPHLIVFCAVYFLENRALIPPYPFVHPERLSQFPLANVQHPNFEHLVRFGIVNQMVQTAPCPLELLKCRMMQYLVQLLG